MVLQGFGSRLWHVSAGMAVALGVACGGGRAGAPGTPSSGSGAPVIEVGCQVLPAGQTVASGSPVTFTGQVKGMVPTRYHWTRDGAELPGVAGANLIIPAASVMDGGQYVLRVTDGVGSIASVPVSLVVVEPPRVVTPPRAQVVSLGAGFQMEVEAAGGAPFSYQWRRDGQVLAGARAATYQVAAAGAGDAGIYEVVIANAVGEVISPQARLEVAMAPRILADPAPVQAAQGRPVTFSVQAGGTGPLTYQWRRDGSALAGAVTGHLVIPAVDLPDAGIYTVQVTSPYGQVESRGAELRVHPLPDLVLEGVHLTQATQTFEGSVPLVDGRDAVLRAFVTAREEGVPLPEVRAHFYQDDALVATMALVQSEGRVPVGLQEGRLAASWNAWVPGALLKPGLSLVVELDPEMKVAERRRDNNRWPSGTGKGLLDVRSVEPFAVTLWSVRTGDAREGDVDDASTRSYVGLLEDLWPIPGRAQVMAGGTFVTTAPDLRADGTGWDTVLFELDAKRIADGARGYYYGVVNPAYAGGVAGLAFVEGRTALGWDRDHGFGNLALRDGVFAHELGHNFGLFHAPGCDASGVDVAFPHRDGGIGAWGLDLRRGQPMDPARFRDVMGYCDNLWVSDYNYRKVLAAMEASGRALSTTMARAEGASGSLLVWGSLVGGEARLQPAFHLGGSAQLPEPGDHLLEGLDATGRRLFSVPFGTHRLGCDTRHRQAFAFSIPWSEEEAARLVEIRWSKAGELLACQRDFQHAAPGADRQMLRPTEVQSIGEASSRVLWDEVRLPLAMVKDRRTGQVVGFGRGGDLRVPLASRHVEVHLSHGVGSRPWSSGRMAP